MFGFLFVTVASLRRTVPSSVQQVFMTFTSKARYYVVMFVFRSVGVHRGGKCKRAIFQLYIIDSKFRGLQRRRNFILVVYAWSLGAGDSSFFLPSFYCLWIESIWKLSSLESRLGCRMMNSTFYFDKSQKCTQVAAFPAENTLLY